MLVYQKVMILKVSLHRFSIRLNNDEGKICMNFPRFNRCSSGNVSGIKAQLRRWRRISVPEFLFHRPLNLVHMYISGHQDKHSKTQIQRRHTEGKCQKYFLMAFSSVVSLRSELACKAKRLKRSAGWSDLENRTTGLRCPGYYVLYFIWAVAISNSYNRDISQPHSQRYKPNRPEVHYRRRLRAAERKNPLSNIGASSVPFGFHFMDSIR